VLLTKKENNKEGDEGKSIYLWKKNDFINIVGLRSDSWTNHHSVQEKGKSLQKSLNNKTNA